ALGVIRLILDNRLRFDLDVACAWGLLAATKTIADTKLKETINVRLSEIYENDKAAFEKLSDTERAAEVFKQSVRLFTNPTIGKHDIVVDIIIDLKKFFADRLKMQLREQGARHDLVDAVFALDGQDDLLLVVRRVDALGKFLDTEDGKNLLAGTKRAANILRIEEKKDGRAYDGAPDPALYSLAEERALAKAIDA